MKVYIASHCREAAETAARELAARGFTITARWMAEPFLPTASYTAADRQRIAAMDVEDVLAADGLLLIAGPDRYSGGKFVEAGIAIGAGRRVVVLGRRENMLLWLDAVAAVETIDAAASALRGGQ